MKSYCKVALKLRGIKTICNKDCPLYNGDCPEIIMEDTLREAWVKMDKSILEAVDAMLRSLNEKKRGKRAK